jgi:hypothetical protein
MSIWVKIIIYAILYCFLGSLTVAILSFYDERNNDIWFDGNDEYKVVAVFCFPVIWIGILGWFALCVLPQAIVKGTVTIFVLIKYSIKAWLGKDNDEQNN